MRISDWSSDGCSSDLSVGAFVVQSFIPRQRKVRILATLGPASANPAMIAELHRAGADAFRVNMSHGDHEGHAKVIAAIRALEKETRSEEHTSELQSLMRNSYAGFCLKKTKKQDDK